MQRSKKHRLFIYKLFINAFFVNSNKFELKLYTSMFQFNKIIGSDSCINTNKKQ